MEHSSVTDYALGLVPQFHIDPPEHYAIVNLRPNEAKHTAIAHHDNENDQPGLSQTQPGEHSPEPTAVLLRKAWLESPSWTGSYASEWYRLFGDPTTQCASQHALPIQTSQLRECAFTGQLRNCRFRSVCWRIHLGILPPDMRHWNMAITRHRRSFQELNYLVNLDPHLSNTRDHPLSLDQQSRWRQHFGTRETKRLIAQDVDRTFPEVEYFRCPQVQISMVNVLCCYVEHTKSDYKQGMHELLAPLFFVLYSDQIAFQHACEADEVPAQLKTYLSTLFTDRYLEADAFGLFSHIMNYVRSWYANDRIAPSQPKTSSTNEADVIRLFNSTPDLSPSDKHVTSNPGVTFLGEVHSKLLQKHNQELYYHLKKLDIVPALFGLRWIRLLFGHEFPLQDLLYIWDCIFAAEENLILVRYLYVSMLNYLGPSLLQMGYSDCLSHLMHFPQGTDVTYLVQVALHFYQPKQYAVPLLTHHSINPNTPTTPKDLSITGHSRRGHLNATSLSRSRRGGINTTTAAEITAAAAIATLSRANTRDKLLIRRNTLFDLQLIPVTKFERRKISGSAMSLNRLFFRDQQQLDPSTLQPDSQTPGSLKSGQKLCSVELHQRCQEVVRMCWNHIALVVDELQRETRIHSNDGDSFSQYGHSDNNVRVNQIEHLQTAQIELEKLARWLTVDEEPPIMTHSPPTDQGSPGVFSFRRTGSLGVLPPVTVWKPKSGLIQLKNGCNKSSNDRDSVSTTPVIFDFEKTYNDESTEYFRSDERELPDEIGFTSRHAFGNL
ncbi:hypothetical protein D915_005724 [Fasciola hepatica]|uniref:Rab-GAP TBC domain-containing protein n=1 Tax=Fasciola hepatica TaxID=6192 RepID=A0A4E0RB88_FASHE|nr:hypothetical protein D915_005724 [Fasciola hepatica]